MKIKANNTYKLRDWKIWYIAMQLGIPNTEASKLVAGEIIEVATAKVSTCTDAIKIYLSPVKTKATKGDKP